MSDRLWYTWYEEVPYICIYHKGVRILIRPATDEDRTDMHNGLMSYDNGNDPMNMSWERLADNGG